jgi:hypothetical protein
VSFQEGCGPYLLGGKPPTPSSISNTGLIDGVTLPLLMGFTTFVAHYDFYTIMNQIHLSPLVDQIQLTLGHISNTRGVEAGYVHRPEIVVLPDPLPSIPGKAAPALRLECSAQTPPMAAWKTPTYAAGTRIGLAISKTRRSE